MSRSGYSDDDEHVHLYRQAVARAMHGVRGQAFLRRLRDALEALPTQRLIADALRDDAGDVCALGAVDATLREDAYDADELARHFGIARAMAAEIVYENDEAWRRAETPEARWIRMRTWVASQIC